MEDLKEQRVIGIERILMRGNPHRLEKDTKAGLKNTGSFILTFKSSVLPQKIEIGQERIEIKQYYPRPRQCKKCYSFNHKTVNCDNEPVCGHCSSTDHTENCTKEAECRNYKKNHKPTEKSCQFYRDEVAIIKIQIDERYNMVKSKFKKSNSITPFSEVISYTNLQTQFDNKVAQH